MSVLTTAELVGGDAHEDYYCPSLEWDWGDGSRSAHETDCAPLAGPMTLERYFRAEHTYRQAGQFAIRLTLRRASRSIAVATASVSVHPGLASR